MSRSGGNRQNKSWLRLIVDTPRPKGTEILEQPRIGLSTALIERVGGCL